MSDRHSPPSLRVFVAGATGSGKSHLLRAKLLPLAQRVICLDFVGEWERHRRQLPGSVVVATDLTSTVAALKRVASRPSWSVIAQLAPDDAPALARMLVPERFDDKTPIFPRAVRGCALVCDELDMLAPHSAPREVTSLWRRGRHVGLSIFGATQSPASVLPIVRGMSRYLVLCQMHEPRSLAYFSPVLSAEVLERVEHLPPREAIVYDTHTREATHVGGRDFSTTLWRTAKSVELTSTAEV